MMNTSEDGLELIRRFEGLRLRAYQDSVGVWTIGYGHTAHVAKGMECSEQQALDWLREDVRTAERCVSSCVTAELTQGEFDALVSWTYNLGCGNLRNSTLLRKLNACDYDGAAAEFERWTKAGGVELAGLVARREAERERFESAA